MNFDVYVSKEYYRDFSEELNTCLSFLSWQETAVSEIKGSDLLGLILEKSKGRNQEFVIIGKDYKNNKEIIFLGFHELYSYFAENGLFLC